MCDTLAATGAATARGGMLFAKNSDRERNEAQALESVPARPAEPGRRARLTYIEIDDAAATHACLISRPFWMWGAEMGANEHGVVIGNEAMHAMIPANRTRALTGMDLVRLGLERAASAAEAVEVITTLLERHGQGGNCGHRNRFYYQNGFMVADPREAYRAWRRWAATGSWNGSMASAPSPTPTASRAAIHAMSAVTARARAEGAEGSFGFANAHDDQRRDEATFGTRALRAVGRAARAEAEAGSRSPTSWPCCAITARSSRAMPTGRRPRPCGARSACTPPRARAAARPSARWSRTSPAPARSTG